MSLTLNDEQEKALRAWYNLGPDNDWRPTDAPTGLRLAEAIAPLMKPWKIVRHELGWKLHGPCGESIYVSEPDRFGNDVNVRRICHLLNESEGRR